MQNTTNCSNPCPDAEAFYQHCLTAIEVYRSVSVRCDNVSPDAAAYACQRMKAAGLTVKQELYGDAVFLQIGGALTVSKNHVANDEQPAAGSVLDLVTDLESRVCAAGQVC